MKLTKSSKIVALIALPIVSVALFGFANPTFLGITMNGNQIPQSTIPFSKSQTLQMEYSLTDILTPNGDFERTHTLGVFPSSEVAYSQEQAATDSGIQEIILPYGIFVKTTAAKEKAQQLADPSWANDHHYQPGDASLIQEALSKQGK
ncbi:MAG: hypothetical protein OWR52_03715 [Acidibacillus sp.]|nr:hypothetical protein [Acidibacillus sp.]